MPKPSVCLLRILPILPVRGLFAFPVSPVGCLCLVVEVLPEESNEFRSLEQAVRLHFFSDEVMNGFGNVRWFGGIAIIILGLLAISNRVSLVAVTGVVWVAGAQHDVSVIEDIGPLRRHLVVRHLIQLDA